MRALNSLAACIPVAPVSVEARRRGPRSHAVPGIAGREILCAVKNDKQIELTLSPDQRKDFVDTLLKGGVQRIQPILGRGLEVCNARAHYAQDEQRIRDAIDNIPGKAVELSRRLGNVSEPGRSSHS